jgi:hypothetical protein
VEGGVQGERGWRVKKAKPWLSAEYTEPYNLFVDWWNRMAESHGFQPASSSTRDHMIGHFYHCVRDTRKDAPFEKYRILEVGLRKLGTWQPTIQWMLVKSERGYGIIDVLEKGMTRQESAKEDWLVKNSRTGG